VVTSGGDEAVGNNMTRFARVTQNRVPLEQLSARARACLGDGDEYCPAVDDDHGEEAVEDQGVGLTVQRNHHAHHRSVERARCKRNACAERERERKSERAMPSTDRTRNQLNELELFAVRGWSRQE